MQSGFSYRLSRVGWAGLFLLLVGFMVGGFVLGAQTWSGWAVPVCYPACFCEAFHSGGIVQPQSSFSNIFYLLVGTAIILTSGNSQTSYSNNWFRRQRSYSITYGMLVILMGVFSLFYHISLTLVGQWLDYIGMYLLFSFLLAYDLLRLRWLSPGWFWVVFIGVSSGLIGLLVWEDELRRYLFTILLISLILLESGILIKQRPHSNQYRYLIPGILIFILSLVLNLLDENWIICIPTSWWQWHVFWHLGTAGAMGLVYLYYYSENSFEKAS
jgi:hypothetical protein